MGGNPSRITRNGSPAVWASTVVIESQSFGMIWNFFIALIVMKIGKKTTFLTKVAWEAKIFIVQGYLALVTACKNNSTLSGGKSL
jgi:hypothetical protein